MNLFYKKSLSDRLFDILNITILAFLSLLILYPIIIVVSSSFSDPVALLAGKVLLFPVNPTLDGYKAVLNHPDIWMGVKNSVFYTVVGTIVSIIITIMTAYPLSRKDFTSAKWISLVFAFTMWFGGGLIPQYILNRTLGLVNTRAVMIVPLALNVWNMIIIRTYFQSSIPNDMLEAAKIDGCDDITFLCRIAVPLSKPAIAVVTLYYAVSYWNVFSHAYIYIQKPDLQPIQVVLRDILLLNKTSVINVDSAGLEELGKSEQMSELLKYSLVVVASLPMVIIYPFIQKYFVKGIMIGGVKG